MTEQSLIEEESPTQRQLDWATGYGCPDGGSCNPRWQGFGNKSIALHYNLETTWIIHSSTLIAQAIPILLQILMAPSVMS